MLPVSIATQLKWVQPRVIQRRFELRAGEHILAELRFQDLFGYLAVAHGDQGTWTLERVGSFNPVVKLGRAGGGKDVAVYRPKSSGTEGAIKFWRGKRFRWEPATLWAREYVIQDDEGIPLILLKRGVENPKLSDFFKTQARVEVTPEGACLPEALMLIVLGWYIWILAFKDIPETQSWS